MALILDLSPVCARRKQVLGVAPPGAGRNPGYSALSAGRALWVGPFARWPGGMHHHEDQFAHDRPAAPAGSLPPQITRSPRGAAPLRKPQAVLAGRATAGRAAVRV